MFRVSLPILFSEEPFFLSPPGKNLNTLHTVFFREIDSTCPAAKEER